MPRFLTKSRFKLGVECPTKLYYSSRSSEYHNVKQHDSFLEMLAEGGFQVGELAKTIYPSGYEIRSKDHAEAEAETRALLKRDEVVLFEPAIRFGDWFIRIDILHKRGTTLQVIEVKAKSYDSSSPKIVGKNGGILSDMLPYIHDIAFQTHVLSSAFPEFQVSSFLMMPDKAKVSTIDGLNQCFKVQHAKGSVSVVVDSRAVGAGYGEEVLALVNVDACVAKVFKDGVSFPGGHESLDGFAHRLADAYKTDTRIAPAIGAQCAKCEFRAPLGGDSRSGFHECWKEANSWSDEDFSAGTVLDLWNFRSKDKLIERKILNLAQVTTEDINFRIEANGISNSQRQWMQIAGVAKEYDKGGFFLDMALLASEMAKWNYPYHFIDFETSAVALPFYAGMHPYEQIAFQFSHHILESDGNVLHAGEFLLSDAGAFPNYEFARALTAQLQADSGSVFMWAQHENMILNRIIRQLEDDEKPPADAEEIATFLRSLTTGGDRAMEDLKALAQKAFFHPDTKGSSSLKVVLPAILKVSEYLRRKYSKPIYGAAAGIRSRNFRDQVWWQENAAGQVVDPYDVLRSSATAMFGDQAESMKQAEAVGIAEGGAAAAAYSRLQFETLDPGSRVAINNALLRYCELDTLAMVQVVEAWRDWCRS